MLVLRVFLVELDRPRYSFMQMLGEEPLAATAPLVAAGLIAYDGERVEIADRAGLEAAGCGCYAIVRDEYERLLSPP